MQSEEDNGSGPTKFYILGGNFFLFDEISKMKILEPKDAFLEEGKKVRGKKFIKSKKTFIKLSEILQIR